MPNTVMQKLDNVTPWHALRDYPTEQEAKMAAYQFARTRGEKEKYPIYSVNGFQF